MTKDILNGLGIFLILGGIFVAVLSYQAVYFCPLPYFEGVDFCAPSLDLTQLAVGLVGLAAGIAAVVVGYRIKEKKDVEKEMEKAEPGEQRA